MSDQLVSEFQARDRRQGDMPFITPEEFWIEYEPITNKPIEMVRWVKRGVNNPPKVEMKISAYLKRPDNPEWIVLKPYYEAWKKQEEPPLDGVPLGAWPGGTPQLAKALKAVNILTVENLAMLEDSSIDKIAIPGLRDKRKQAKAYLDALQNTAAVSAEVAVLRDKLEKRDRRLKELEEMIIRLATPKPEIVAPLPEPLVTTTIPLVTTTIPIETTSGDPTQLPKRRGRPPGTKNKPK